MKRISNIFALFLLTIVGGTMTAHAQSTYTWTASDWAHAYENNGTVTESDGTLTCTYGLYCGSVSYQGTPFKLPKRQTFIVVKGTNLGGGEGDPNVCDVNGKLPQTQGYFTGNGGTMIYKDITSLLPEETDFFGNVTINSFALYLKKGDTPATITSIEFVAADLLDLSSSSNIAFASGSLSGSDVATITSIDETAGKKTLKLRQTSSNGDMGMTFKFADYHINSSDMFFVVESNINVTESNRLKLRNFTADGTQYGNNATNYGLSNVEVSTGHYLTIHNFCANSEQATNWIAKTATTQYLNTTEYRVFIPSKQNRDVEIYRMGFYNLAEIIALYPTLAKKWAFDNGGEGYCAIKYNSGTDNQISNFSGAGSNNTIATAVQRFRSLGVLPADFTQLMVRHFNFAADQVPMTEDVFRDMPATLTIFMNPAEMVFFPTMNTHIKVAGYNPYKQFKDGVSPTNVAITNDGASAPWSSITRAFKEGYNTCVLPFNKPQYASLPAGLTVYTFTGASGDNITFTKQTANSDANFPKSIPVIVKAEKAGLYMITGRDAETTFNNYTEVTNGNFAFVGSYVEEAPTASGNAYAGKACYGITASGDKFAKFTETTKTTYYRAFLVDKSTSGARALSLSFDDGNGTTEIVHPEAVDGLTQGVVYDLQGRKLTSNPTKKGLYIVNGKKVLYK